MIATIGHTHYNLIIFIKHDFTVDDYIMVTPRRVGYILSLIIMILGILAIPLGLLVGVAGFFESLGTGDASAFGGGVY